MRSNISEITQKDNIDPVLLKLAIATASVKGHPKSPILDAGYRGFAYF